MNAALNTIHLGDCVAGMNSLPAGSIDLAFADPPFNIGYDYDVYDDQKEHEHYLAWSREWISAVHRVLKPTGTFWLAIGDEYAAELKLESQKIGFHTRSWVIWYYTFGVNCVSKFTRSHAHLFYFVKDKAKFTFRAEELENRIPSARQLVYNDSRANPNGRLPDDTWVLRPQDLAGCFTPEEDTWYFPRVAGTFKERAGFHGCQMPEQLLGRIIRTCSQEGETVLDPFSGSASTLVTAKKLKRKFVGFDLSEDYVVRGKARLDRTKLNDPLDGSAEPTMSAPATDAGVRGRAKTKKSVSQFEIVRERAEAAEIERHQQGNIDALIVAFSEIHQGYSPDRVVADPELNARFATACDAAGLFGDIRFWNRSLFALRKQGRLKHLKTTERTEIDWQECESFLFASEIAWRELAVTGGGSLDDILCDPESAARFDEAAARWAPGHPAWHYRWGALKLRKESKKTRDRADRLDPQLKAPFPEPIRLGKRESAKIPATAGVYLLADEAKKPIYAGESFNLRERVPLFADAYRQNCKDRSPLTLSFFTTKHDISILLAYQALWVREHNPALNLPELALA